MIERKADHKDLKALIDDKVSKSESHLFFVPRNEFDALKKNAETAVNSLNSVLTRDCK